jgi:threonine/homoserine/homoserine lactone efflux protein
MITYLIMGITFGFAASVQPGPFQTFIISRSLQNGWRNTLPVAIVPLITDIPVILLILLILVNIPVWMEGFLYLAGGCFVLYLAFGAFRSFKNYSVNQEYIVQSRHKTVFKAALVNLLNPNVYIYWSLVTGPLLLKGWSENNVYGISLVGGFYTSMILTLAAIIIIFSIIGKYSSRISRILVGISSIALAGFAIYQIWLGIVTLQNT